jgi:hypothetical protein
MIQRAQVSPGILLLVLCGITLLGSAAAGESVEDLDEVSVTGKKLRVLEREAIEAEDSFYKRFNALNTRDDFDIRCRKEKTTGTNIPQRQCNVKFLEDAEAKDAQEFHMGLIAASAAIGVNTPNAVLQPLWAQRREEYRQAARALLEKDPELMALANKWLRLREQYDRAYKERHKDKIVLFE